MAERDADRIAIDFIDPLFAVVLSISFGQILDEKWFNNFRLIFSRQYGFEVATLLLLGYGTVTLSWIGYHQSIAKAQIKATGQWGFWRFIFDILLLIAYFVLLVSFENFFRVLWTLFVIFLLYVPWDQFKRLEHPQLDCAERRGVTVFWLAIFLLLALLYTVLPAVQEYRILFLIACFSALVVYRQHKKHPWPKRCLRKLGYPAKDA